MLGIFVLQKALKLSIINIAWALESDNTELASLDR